MRIGQPVKVRASLREATLDARLEHHPLQEDLAALREEHDTLKRGLSGLRGKERGLAHKDLSMQRREMQRLERQMIDGLLDGAEVVCATTVAQVIGSSGRADSPSCWWTRPRKRASPAASCPSFAGAAILFWWAITVNCHPRCSRPRHRGWAWALVVRAPHRPWLAHPHAHHTVPHASEHP